MHVRHPILDECEMTMRNDAQDIIRGAVEIGTGAPLASAPLWFHYLAEVNVILATISLTLGVVLGFHGVWRLVRSYRRRR